MSDSAEDFLGSSKPAADSAETFLSTPERSTFATSEGGAAFGRPGKVSAVKPTTPLEAFGVGAVSRPVSTAVGAAQLATGGRVGTDVARKQAGELQTYKQQYPLATGAGEVAGDVGEFLAMGGAGKTMGVLKGSEAALKRRLAEQAVIGGVQAGVKATPETEGMYKKAGARAALGMATGAAGEAGATALGRQLDKLGGLSDSRRFLVNIAEKYGIKLTPGEITGNPVLKGTDRLFSYMPLTAGKIKAINESNEDKVAEVVLKAMGYNGKEVNEQILGLAKDALKTRYSDVLKDTTVTLDRQLQKDLLNIANENFIATTFQNTPKTQRLMDLLKGVEGKISGEEYNEIRSIIGQYATNSADDRVASILYSMQRAVDNAAERTVRPTAYSEEWGTFMSEKMRRLAKEESAAKTKEIVDNLKALRKQYTVYQDVFDAAYHKGLTPDGGLSLAKLYDAVNRRRPQAFQSPTPGRTPLPTEELAYLQKIKGEPVQAATLAKTIPYILGVGGVGTGAITGPAVLGVLGGLRGGQAALYSEPVKKALTEGVSPTTRQVTPELVRALGLGMGLPFANKVAGQ